MSVLEKATFVLAVAGLFAAVFAVVEIYLLDKATDRRMERFVVLLNAIFDLIEARKIAETRIIEALREEKRPCN